jgi:predicted DNA-binding transcriptional regulator AlpA
MSDRILRLQEVMSQTGLCRSHVYGLEGFPKPFKLGNTRAVGWSEAAVQAWIRVTIPATKPEFKHSPAVRNRDDDSDPRLRFETSSGLLFGS